MSSKVSVIIPCYNAEKFISKTLTSVIEQEHDNIEIIAIDNESNDKTYDILEKFSKDHGNIKIDQAENIYPFCWDEARAKGLEISTGDYITTLCSDDYFERDYIKKCVQIMDTLKNKISLFQSPIRGVDINGNEVNRIGHKYNNMEEFKNTAINRCPVTSPTVFYKRELYDKGFIKKIFYWKQKQNLNYMVVQQIMICIVIWQTRASSCYQYQAGLDIIIVGMMGKQLGECTRLK